MFEYEGGYVLPHIIDFVKISEEKNAFHGKISGELEPISLEDAAKRVMYNFFEEHAWNVDESTCILPENPKTVEEQAMKRFSNEVGIESLASALDWCQEIRYGVLQEKRQLFQEMLQKENKLEEGNRVR